MVRRGFYEPNSMENLWKMVRRRFYHRNPRKISVKRRPRQRVFSLCTLTLLQISTTRLPLPRKASTWSENQHCWILILNFLFDINAAAYFTLLIGGELRTTVKVYQMTGVTERSIRYYATLNLLKAKKNGLEKFVQTFAAKMTGYFI